VPRDARARHDPSRGRTIYAPGGELLHTGDRLEQHGLANALELLRDEGARTFYDGTVAETLVALMQEREGPVSMEDLDAYEPLWLEPVETEYLGYRVSRVAASHSSSRRCPRSPRRGRERPERVLTLARVLEAPPYSGQGEQIGDTTNLVAVDRDGMPASSRRASAWAPATSCPASTCT
jgi:hypothetical protein